MYTIAITIFIIDPPLSPGYLVNFDFVDGRVLRNDSTISLYQHDSTEYQGIDAKLQHIHG